MPSTELAEFLQLNDEESNLVMSKLTPEKMEEYKALRDRDDALKMDATTEVTYPELATHALAVMTMWQEVRELLGK